MQKSPFGSDKVDQTSLSNVSSKMWLPWFLLVLALILSWFLFKKFFYTHRPGISEKHHHFESGVAQVFTEAALEIQKRFEKGDIEGFFKQRPDNCLDEIGPQKNTHPFFLRCNPNYLQCFFSGRTDSNPVLNITKGGKTYHAKVLDQFPVNPQFSPSPRFYEVVTRGRAHGENVPSYGIKLRLSLVERPDLYTELVLEDTCRDTYLPWGTYAYGADYYDLPGGQKPATDTHDFKWDNKGRHIYVDKYMVTNRDIIEWVTSSPEKINIKLITDKNALAQAAGNLTFEQMKMYCAFRGKQLMDALVYDAASFYPQGGKTESAGRLFRTPFPWSQSYKNEHFYSALLKKETFKVTEKNCSRVYVKDCLGKVSFLNYSNWSSTWTEMNQVLGGPLEAMRNSIDEKFNLRPSSYYFSSRVPWHLLGRRVGWNGEGHQLLDFTWKDVPNVAKLGEYEQPPVMEDSGDLSVGFRCMKLDYRP